MPASLVEGPRPADPDELPARVDLIVVGAGTMGAWTAYWAARSGRTVLLLDAWGTGHPRATSGDESRIIRSAHGADAFYARWARRAREQWLQLGEETGVPIFVPTGVLWFGHRDGGFEDESLATLQAEGIPAERLSADELRLRWPQLGADDGMSHALYEPEAGTLMARRGCQVVTSEVQRLGGSYGLAGVRPGRAEDGRLLEVVDSGGRAWSADLFVFACGPWLRPMFPELLATTLRVTKQDMVFVGPRAGDRRFHGESMPAWADYDAAYYGVPALDDRGFKLAPDRYGPVFDPTNGERVVDPESVRLARRYLAARFPDLADAPVVETRVCQYESTPDAHFIIDRHPDWSNAWLLGGGSGHGYKHGPRIGEYLVARLDGAAEGDQDGPGESRFRLGPRSAGSAARTGGDAMAERWQVF
jgi:glycine/D-amino acid oxidase-like deaminating enzyme